MTERLFKVQCTKCGWEAWRNVSTTKTDAVRPCPNCGEKALVHTPNRMIEPPNG